MKKSKTIYVVTLLLLMGIALIDHLQPSRDSDHVVVTQSENPGSSAFQFAFLPFN